VLRLVAPGSDEFVTERYAFEIGRLLDEWSQALKSGPPAFGKLTEFMDASVEGASFAQSEETSLRSGGGIEVMRRRFAANPVAGRERFLQEIKNYLASFAGIETAEFEIVSIKEVASSPADCGS